MTGPDSCVTIHIPFFEGLDEDVQLHLLEVKAYKSGMVTLHHDLRR
jgi:hypothetical protein